MATYHRKKLCFVRDVNKHARYVYGKFHVHLTIVSRLIHYSTIMLRFIALCRRLRRTNKALNNNEELLYLFLLLLLLCAFEMSFYAFRFIDTKVSA